jgi:hypothetical protein
MVWLLPVAVGIGHADAPMVSGIRAGEPARLTRMSEIPPPLQPFSGRLRAEATEAMQAARHKEGDFIMSGASETDIESLIDIARTYGTDDPEQEIAALQDLLRTAWGLMAEAQQVALVESDEAQALLNPDTDDPDEAADS